MGQVSVSADRAGSTGSTHNTGTAHNTGSAHGEGSKELDRLYRAAQLYYERGATQEQVATELGVSRPSVSRMLGEARRQGIVEIRVHRPRSGGAEAMEAQLCQALGLQAVHIAPGDQSDRLGPGLAGAARSALAEADLRSGDALLIASGATPYALAQQNLGDFRGVVVAPTVGGQAEPDAWHQTNEVVRAFAVSTGAYPRYLFAPSMPSPALLEALHDDPGFRQVLDDWAQAKAALVGIGAPAMTRVSIARSVPREHPSLAASVGDVCLAFFDEAGAEITFPGSERMVRIPSDTLRAVPTRIGAAVGGAKVPSIIAAARGGWVTALVTDEETARGVLSRC